MASVVHWPVYGISKKMFSTLWDTGSKTKSFALFPSNVFSFFFFSVVTYGLKTLLSIWGKPSFLAQELHNLGSQTPGPEVHCEQGEAILCGLILKVQRACFSLLWAAVPSIALNILVRPAFSRTPLLTLWFKPLSAWT